MVRLSKSVSWDEELLRDVLRFSDEHKSKDFSHAVNDLTRKGLIAYLMEEQKVEDKGLADKQNVTTGKPT